MLGGHLVREARRRAELTQTQLATRLGTKQSVVARWETGRNEPSLETIVRVARECGFDLAFSLARRDVDHERLIRDYLRMTPAERLADLLDRAEVEARLRRQARPQ